MGDSIKTFALATTLMAGGCKAADGLAAFEGGALFVGVYNGSTGTSVRPLRPGGGCGAAATDFAGTLNGAAMTLETRGGWRESSGFEPDHCEYPTLRLAERVAPKADGHFELRLWDSTGQIDAEFGDFLSPRAATIATSAPQPVFVGDEVAVSLSPRSVAPQLGEGISLWVEPPKSNTVWTNKFNIAGRKTGDEVRFVVPAIDGESTTNTLVVEVTPSLSAATPVHRCQGVSTCAVTDTDEIAPVDLAFINRRADETDFCYRCECPCAGGRQFTYSTEPFRCDPRNCECPEGTKTTACTSHVPVANCPVAVPVAGGDCSAYAGGSCHFQDCSAMGITNLQCTPQKTWKLDSAPCHPTPCGATKTCAGGEVCLTDKRTGTETNTCIPNPCGTGPVAPECLALGAGCRANYGVPAGLTITCE